MIQGYAGVILLNEYIPKQIQFKPNQTIDSKVFKAKMIEYAKGYPKEYARNISKIAVLGEKMAYSLGANVGPKDLKGDVKANQKLMKSLDKKLSKAKTDREKKNILMDGLAEATDLAKKINQKDNDLAQQLHSGSRGKPVQMARLAVGPIYAVDINQQPKLNLIRNNFTNGLGSQEYFNVSSQGRYASVMSATATSEPGALGKVIVANTDAEKISMLDCRTKNGQFRAKTSKHVVGLYEAGTNILITRDYLKKFKAPMIKVRTPVTCQAAKGLCVKCYGLKANGKEPHIGENIGLHGAQTVSEILTQMTISTKHSTAGKKDTDKLEGVEGFKILANSPASFSKEALVAETDGIISNLKVSPQGGQEFNIGRKKYYLPPNLKLKVKNGQRVAKGEQLSSGTITPRQVVAHRSLNEAREYESDSLHDLFHRSTGQDLMKKHFDVMARGHLMLSKNKYGDIGKHSAQAARYPNTKQSAMVTNSIKGKYVAEDVGSISKGTEINDRVLALLKKWNISKIEVTTQKPSFTPIFKSIEQRPSFGGSIFQRMNYRHIVKSLKDEITQKKNPEFLTTYDSDRGDHTAGYLVPAARFV